MDRLPNYRRREPTGLMAKKKARSHSPRGEGRAVYYGITQGKVM